MAGAVHTFGTLPIEEPGPKTGLLMTWGDNVTYFMGGEIREGRRAALLSGAKLIVVDPKRVDLAKRADLWISPRPQTDGILALGMIKVAIEEELYDSDFVDNWTVGFDRLREHVGTFSLEDVEKFTWVPQAQIREAARLVSKNRPLSLAVGNGLERGMHAFQQLRAVYIFQALFGDVNTPGGNAIPTPAPFSRMGRFYQLKGSPRDLQKGLCSPFKVGVSSAYVPPQSLIKAILYEEPYPIRAAMCILSNPLMSYPDTEETFKAFKKLDFFVVSELFPTPSTAVADIVLPAAWQAEHDTLGYWAGWWGEIRAYPQIVEPPGEAWPDPKWINELGKRVGLEKYFWNDWQECLDEILEPSGLTWEQFKQKRVLHATKEYKKPEEGIFRTSSGKVELYSERLAKLDCSPMPVFEELHRISSETSEEYPLLFFNGKEAAYMLTGYKHVPYARALKPQPTVELNPKTAEKFGLKEGEWIYIETKKGRIKQILTLDPDLDPKLVFLSFGWWFPEEPEDLFQFRKSNINVLVSNDPPYDPATGSLVMEAIPCRVYKA